jgi:hypothetical protein
MALYISNARRTRRVVVAAAVAAVLGLVIGWLIGRQQVPSIDERVGDVRDEAANVATAIERLDIEYEQVLGGTDDLQSSVLTPIDELRADLQHAMDRAPWLTSAQRSPVLDEVAQLRDSAEAREAEDSFHAHVASAAAAVRDLFGVSP